MFVAKFVLLALLPFLAFGPSQNPAPATLAQGRALLNQQDFAGAAKIFRRLTEQDPSDAWAWYLLGFALHGGGDMDAALVAHMKASEFPATASGAMYNAACAYSRKGDVESGFEWLRKAIDAGFANRNSLATDADLANLRTDPRFLAMLPPLLEGEALFVEEPRIIHTLVGEAAGDQFGWVARVLGDLDGDGVLDFAATAPTATTTGPGGGRVYVYSGKKCELLFTFSGAPGAGLGNGVCGAGDVDADGVPDVIAGAPAGGARVGKAFVYSGKDGTQLLELSAGEAGDSFGLKVCGLGDVNGDGQADVLVGATRSDAGGGVDSGRCYGYSGADGSLLFTLDGEAAGDNFGSAVDAPRDSGHALFAVGAMNAGGKGRIYVYRLEGGEPTLAFTIDPDSAGQNLGQYFVSFGDVNADGIPDVYGSDWGNANSTGRVYVHSGKDGTRLLSIAGTVQGEGFGTSPSQAGDVDSDGCDDLIVGAWQNREAAQSGGKVYLHSGKDGELLGTYTCKQSGDTFGFDATGLGDVDGDGGIDFLLTSAWSPVKGAQTGRVFVIAGPVFEKAQ